MQIPIGIGDYSIDGSDAIISFIIVVFIKKIYTVWKHE